MSQPIHASYHVPATPNDVIGNPMPSLTPDALMAYCETRLRGITVQMNQYFANQKKGNDDSAAINDALEAMNKYANGTTARPQNDEMIAALENARDRVNAGSDTPAGARLQKIICDLKGAAGEYEGGNPGGGIADKTVQGLTEQVKNVQQDINRDSELNMINLQSIMAQRQTAIQMTTNLVQSLGEQSKMIAANIGK